MTKLKPGLAWAGAIVAAMTIVVLMVGAALYPTEPPARPAPPGPVGAKRMVTMAASDPVRILAVGDSITWGGQWQAELSRLLDKAGVPHAIDTEGVAGVGTMYWPARMRGILDAHKPDLVILATGTNDDVNAAKYGERATGWAFRSIVETIHGYRPDNPIKILPTLIQYSDPLIAPDWLLTSEPITNDTIWTQIRGYLKAGWFAGVADLQVIPATADYLDTGGIHPTARGYKAMGRIFYDAAHVGMGWPACTEPPLTGLYGHRKGYPRPSYLPNP